MAKASTASKPLRLVSALAMLMTFSMASAKCGSVNYTWGANALATAHDFVVTMMLYTLYICYAIAAIVVIYSSLQIYIKMNIGEEGIVKDILMLIGAIFFIIGAGIVFPAFFGYQV